VIVMESRHGRRFVVRIDRGEDVVASIKKLAQSERVRAAWVRGTGLCEWAEVTDWDPSREALRPPRHLAGPLALLACEGNVSMRLGEPYVELRAAMSREGDSGLVVLGGQLVLAAALNVEVMIDVFEDVRLDRDEERETGLSVWKGERTQGVLARPLERSTKPSAASGALGREVARAPLPAPQASRPTPEVEPEAADDAAQAPSATSGAALGWADVARASSMAEASKPPSAVVVERKSPSALVATVPIFDKPKERADADGEEPIPKKGDWVDHRQFGLCRVDGENVDGGLLIRLPSGMRKVVHLETLEALPPRYEGDRRIYPLRPRKR
jgi:predicted DNA-binding protein with PD1-like motif